MFPIAEVAEIGRKLGVPLIMDNTAAPLMCRPFDHGAAIVVYSTTKYIGGHGTSIGGMIVDGGNFDWEAKGALPDANDAGSLLSRRDLDRGGEAIGAGRLYPRARTALQRDLGMSMSPFNAFQFIQGLETLPLRMREHCRNASGRAVSETHRQWRA